MADTTKKGSTSRTRTATPDTEAAAADSTATAVEDHVKETGAEPGSLAGRAQETAAITAAATGVDIDSGKGNKPAKGGDDDKPAIQHASDHVASATRGGDRPDQLTRENIHEEALYGHNCVVVNGEHEGRYGVYVDTVEVDSETGKPSRILFRSRDADNIDVVVDYKDVRPAESRGAAPR